MTTCQPSGATTRTLSVRRNSAEPPRPAGPELPAREVLRRRLAAMAGEKESEDGA